jgi:hypothetical protein
MNQIALSLDCRNWGNSAKDYVDVTAQNGKQYSFKYIGGEDGAGTVTVPQGNPTTIKVTVGSDARYVIDSIVVTNDPYGDITASFSGNVASLIDSATDVEENIYYTITVRDTVAGTKFLCDPKIKNAPLN